MMIILIRQGGEKIVECSQLYSLIITVNPRNNKKFLILALNSSMKKLCYDALYPLLRLFGLRWREMCGDDTLSTCQLSTQTLACWR